MPERIPNGVAKRVVFRAISSTDHFTPKTGVTIAITISKNGGAFGNPAAGATNATEISSGFYYFDLGTGDTGTNGPLAWRGAVGTIDDVGDVYEVVAATNAGFSALPNAAAEAAGGLYTRGTGAGQIAQDANGNVRVNLDTIKTQTVTCAAGVTVLASVGTAATSTAQTGDTYALANGASGFVAIKGDTAAILDDTGTAGVVVAAASKSGYSLTATTGLGNQTADITGSLSGSVGSVTGNVGGNVTGSVGSVAAGGITASSIAADAIGASELAADAVAEIAAAVLTTQMTEDYRADGAAPTLAQGICETLAHLGESSISGTTKTIKKVDGSTTAATFTLDDATTPTSITRAT